MQANPRNARAAAAITQVHHHVRALVQAARRSSRPIDAVIGDVVVDMHDGGLTAMHGATGVPPTLPQHMYALPHARARTVMPLQAGLPCGCPAGKACTPRRAERKFASVLFAAAAPVCQRLGRTRG